MTEINWLEKAKASSKKTKIEGEVRLSIVIINRKSVKSAVALAFRHGSEEKISKTGYIVIGLSDNRIYFREATAKDGYSICQLKTSSYSKYVKVARNEHLVKDYREFVGEYNLELDEEKGLFFIDLENKLA